MSSLILDCNKKFIIDSNNAVPTGVYHDATLGQGMNIELDGIDITINNLTLQRCGRRFVSLLNGTRLGIGQLRFASLGAAITFRIGENCSIVFDAGSWDPEVISHTTFIFNSQGTGKLKYYPFYNPSWLNCPIVTGYKKGDCLEIVDERNNKRFQVQDGRIVPSSTI